MKERNFHELLEAQWALDKFVSVGLDSEFGKIPVAARQATVGKTLLRFNQTIIDATGDIACAFKINIAFYKALGYGGLRALRDTIVYSHEVLPDVPVILDFKCGDIENTNIGYVNEAFAYFNADAATVHPYLGGEALQPFLNLKSKGIFVICRTSNPGAGEIQDQLVYLTEHDCQELFYNEFSGKCTADIPNDPITMPVYQYVAYRVANHWNKNGNCALVVGATYPEELREVRRKVGDIPILSPGSGAQGGDVKKTFTAGKDSRGRGIIIHSSRSIIFASDGPDFAEAARREIVKLHEMVNQCR